VFLDKVCIHQTDKDIQRKGIEKLGAYLCNSERMVIVYTDVYLKKLWTIYEVAAFLCLHPVDKMVVIPALLPLVSAVIPTIVIWFVGCLNLMSILWGLKSALWLPLAVFGLIGIAVTVLSRKWGREAGKIHDTLTNFRVQECVCFCEDDRSFVYRNIVKFMKAVEAIDSQESEEEGLEAFNELVRGKVRQALLYSIGERGSPFFLSSTWPSVFTAR